MKPEELLYSATHEWAHIEPSGAGKAATIGISAFAVEQLTDLVFMSLPKVGETVQAGKEFGEVESVKAVSSLYSPVDGEIVAVNTALPGKLETLNQDPYGNGWLIKVRITDESGLKKLLDHKAYQAQCAAES